MTDLELLQLAAKAAGLETICSAADRGLWIRGYEPEWNPLQNNDDALWLLIELRLSVASDEQIEVDYHQDYGKYAPGVEAWLVTDRAKLIKAWELYHQDPQAATRRAIVRAAAEIGKEMK
jgi:hypothetical protein